VKKWDADLIREQFGIPGCRALIRFDKEVRHPRKPPSFENCLHLAKDRHFEEDKHVVRGWGKPWTVLTNVTVSLIRLLRTGE
jgi:hypothetical protein